MEIRKITLVQIRFLKKPIFWTAEWALGYGYPFSPMK